MSIDRLISKYAIDPDIATTNVLPPSENDIHKQKMAAFAHELRDKFRLVIAELEGDLLTLRYRQFDKDMFGTLRDIWNKLIKMNKELGTHNPLEVAHEVVEYVRGIKQVIDNIEFLAKRHVESTNVDTRLTGRMRHPKLRGLSTLLRFVEFLEDEIRKMTPPSTTQKTWKPPAMPKDLEKVPSLSIKPPPMI